MQIEVEALRHRKIPLEHIDSSAQCDSFIIFYHGLKVDCRIIANSIGLHFKTGWGNYFGPHQTFRYPG